MDLNLISDTVHIGTGLVPPYHIGKSYTLKKCSMSQTSQDSNFCKFVNKSARFWAQKWVLRSNRLYIYLAHNIPNSFVWVPENLLILLWFLRGTTTMAFSLQVGGYQLRHKIKVIRGVDPPPSRPLSFCVCTFYQHVLGRSPFPIYCFGCIQRGKMIKWERIMAPQFKFASFINQAIA